MGNILAFNKAAGNKVAFTPLERKQITALIDKAKDAGLEIDHYKFHRGKLSTAFCLYTKDDVKAPYIVLSKESEGGPYRYRLTSNETHNLVDSVNFKAVLPQIEKTLARKTTSNDNPTPPSPGMRP